jgi:small subunit ribosomal protein S16
MSVKIRLARHGRKQHAYYHIVVANSRSPRDGRFIERIGSYNPNTNPATIDLDFDKAITWLNNGAQPTDTCRTILSHKGVMMKKHLLEGVKKGAFDLAEVDVRFAAWVKDKENSIQAKKDGLAANVVEDKKNRLKAEVQINEARIVDIAKKNAAAAAAAEAKPAQEEAEEEEDVTEEVAEVEENEVADEVAEVEAAEEVAEEVAEVEVTEEEAAPEEVVAEEEVEAPEATEAPEADTTEEAK